MRTILESASDNGAKCGRVGTFIAERTKPSKNHQIHSK